MIAHSSAFILQMALRSIVVCDKHFNITMDTMLLLLVTYCFSSMIDSLAQNGNKVIDMILINMRRTLLQNCREVLEVPPLHATFMHKVFTETS